MPPSHKAVGQFPPGVRVVRGPDWDLADSDADCGVAGNLGTTIEDKDAG
jgi:hypothetical protein